MKRTFKTHSGTLHAWDYLEGRNLLEGKMTVWYEHAPAKTMSMNLTFDQLERWRAGELIQRVMPDLSADEREFLMTGMTSEDWDAMFPDEADEAEDSLVEADNETSGVDFEAHQKLARELYIKERREQNATETGCHVFGHSYHEETGLCHYCGVQTHWDEMNAAQRKAATERADQGPFTEGRQVTITYVEEDTSEYGCPTCWSAPCTCGPDKDHRVPTECDNCGAIYLSPHQYGPGGCEDCYHLARMKQSSSTPGHPDYPRYIEMVNAFIQRTRDAADRKR